MTRTTTLGALLLLCPLAGCTAAEHDPFPSDHGATSLRTGEPIEISDVSIGQLHLLQPDDPYFGLVSEREALLEAHVAIPPFIPFEGSVIATLTAGGQSTELELDASPGAPTSTSGDVFTGIIPAQWVAPGLEVSVRVEDQGEVFDDVTHLVSVGAPNRLEVTMFDIRYFGAPPEDYSPGWDDELAHKLPVSHLEVQRVEQIFDQMVIPPNQGQGVGAILTSSAEDYEQQTGVDPGGWAGKSAAREWFRALAKAGGQSRRRMTYVNTVGLNAGGIGKELKGAGGVTDATIGHQMGQLLGLVHNDEDPAYPYQGSLYGIESLCPGEYRVGPVWGLDLRALETLGPRYISPLVQPQTVGNPSLVGTWKCDPMGLNGGGSGDQEQGDLFRMFSDYSVATMRAYLEQRLIVWNEGLGSWAAWNPIAGDYTTVVNNNGVTHPIEPDVDVITVMAAASAVAPVSHIYPPIGPYRSGLIERFDASDPADRLLAEAIYCPNDGCDLSLEVQQGGVTTRYLLPISWDPGANPLSAESLGTAAINLPASDGSVTSVELLLTLDAEQGEKALGSSDVLAAWP